MGKKIADFDTPDCCARPAHFTHDYKRGVPPIGPDDREAVVNRGCHGCGKHWFGVQPDVKEFSRGEWDAYLEEDSRVA